ncbi:MAG: SH3 domain-containing protein [Peptococcaceae bacterium]|jgi:hypothetical protein|nr:SH3 domain-containing protein [Peptococcaceae bacterium]
MRRIDWKVFVIIGLIVSVTVGFLYGTGFLGGGGGEPGSSDDPLITSSYAEGTIERQVADLDQKVAELTSQIQALENELAILNGAVGGGTAVGGAGTGTGGGTATGGAATGGGTTTPPATANPGTGTGGQPVSAGNVGKTAAVTNNPVNLRESASTSSNILKKLTPTDTFEITKVDNDWYQVRLSDGTIGWVAGYLVKVK